MGKDQQLNVRVSAEDLAAIKKAAEREGKPLATFVRDSALGASRSQLKVIAGPWVCDRCRHDIATAKDGWLQFQTREAGPKGGQIEIVHHGIASPLGFGGCYPEAWGEKKWGDMDLSTFLGPQGVIPFLRLLRYRLDRTLFLEVLHRLYVPRYEEARRYRRAAMDAGIIPETGIIPIDGLEAIIRAYKDDPSAVIPPIDPANVLPAGVLARANQATEELIEAGDLEEDWRP